jgi:chemotaxis response regulator CheB
MRNAADRRKLGRAVVGATARRRERGSTEARPRDYRLVVIAASAGGLPALGTVLQPLPKSFPLPVAIVQHVDPRHVSLLPQILARYTDLQVKEAASKDLLLAGTAFIAPPMRT